MLVFCCYDGWDMGGMLVFWCFVEGGSVLFVVLMFCGVRVGDSGYFSLTLEDSLAF